jgi:hypothetical protein
MIVCIYYGEETDGGFSGVYEIPLLRRFSRVKDRILTSKFVIRSLNFFKNSSEKPEAHKMGYRKPGT